MISTSGKSPRAREKSRVEFSMLVLAGSIVFALSSVATKASGAECTEMKEVKAQEWTGDIINIVPWVAQEAGIFEKHCLDVTMVSIVSGPGSLSAVVSGAIQFASGAPDSPMRARSNGVDLRLIANTYAAQWSALVGRIGLELPHADEGYPAIMQDLVGKKIGVTVLGGTTEAFVRSSFSGAGLSDSDTTFIAVGGAATAIPALQNSVVDAAMMFGTGPEIATALGAGDIVLDLRKPDVGPDEVQALLGATLSWAGYGPFIEENPELVAAFAAANDEAIKWIRDPNNRDAVYAVIEKRMPLPDGLPDREAVLKRIIDVNVAGLGTGIPRKSIEGWNSYLTFLKQIPEPIPYDDLVSASGRQ